ncbi:MAG: glucuronate isomerase [Trueperaceae bacterium]|nr:glucuronate isomerase [Trueperaceae bacterium]
MPTPWTLDEDRCFSPEPAVRDRARELYAHVRGLPLVCPHGHVPPDLLADPEARFGDPAELLITPDHYVFRMLYSQGVPMQDVGVPTRDGSATERDHRAVWRRLCENFHLFRGTPTGLWLKAELIELFGVREKPTAANADALYDQVQARLQQDDFRPRALFERFDIEMLATTDAATDDLDAHARIRADGLPVRPTFRPDALMKLTDPSWQEALELLQERTGREIIDLTSFTEAIWSRRAYFQERGATASDHGVQDPLVAPLPASEAEALFTRALDGRADEDDQARFHGHMLFEMAGMAREDGLVMQVHAGSFRDHHPRVYDRFGPDKGADIPIAVDWTRGLHALLNEHGFDPAFRLIVYTLDESTYARELAPLAGHYPALRLGAPWWFYDSVLGMDRYLDRVVETAGIYNLAGFNDDTRAFPSIPTRHDVWRRTSANWLAGMTARGLIDEDDAPDMAHWLAYGAAKDAYRLA